MEGEEFRKKVAKPEIIDDFFNPGKKIEVWKLDEKKEKEQDLCVKYLRCLARTHPDDKKLFVKLLKARNNDYMVCSTGD